MDTQPISTNCCPKCHTPLPPDAPQGLCPKCLFAAVATPTEAGQPAGHRATPPPLEEIAAAFPQLEILEFVGQGGMGFVFKARQPKLDRLVALKILPQSLAADPTFAERFNREARLLARLNHPGIVTVHDFGVASPQPSTINHQPFYYLLMEFVDGVNLRQAMQAGRFTPEQALAIVPKICEALQFAHNEGILHRDIKPENILLDAKGRVKLADFGIAKLMEHGPAERSAELRFGASLPSDPTTPNRSSALQFLTETGKALGTPNYMAPEQLANAGEVDHRADIYSLGVVFYEMLTGELPLGRFAPPSQRSAADPRVDEVVLRALEKEKTKRYASADEVRTQVETLVTSSSGRESAPTESERGEKRTSLGGYDLSFPPPTKWTAAIKRSTTIFFCIAVLLFVYKSNDGRVREYWDQIVTILLIAFLVDTLLRIRRWRKSGDAARSRSSGLKPAQTESGNPPQSSQSDSPSRPITALEISAHATDAEKQGMKKLQVAFGIWSTATFFSPLFCVMIFPIPVPLNWIIASLVLLVGLAFHPYWWSKIADQLCATAWAKERSCNPATLSIYRHATTGIMLMGVVIFVIVATLWWQTYEPPGVWLPYLARSSIPDQDGEMLFRVTDVSRRKQIVLVRITCEPAMARYRMFATDSGPAFELPEGITNEARDVDCLITPDVNHSVGKVLVGTNTFSGKPEYLIGFVLPDERAAARAIEQVHRFYLADSKGLTKNHASLPLFSLRRSLGKDAEGKPVFESIYCSLMRDVWSASRRSNAGKPSFGPVTEMTIQLPTPGPSNTPARPKTAGSFSAPKTAVIDGATDQTLLTTNVGLFVGEVKAPEGQESPRLMNCVNALLSDLRPEDWDLATLAKINAALVTPTILGAPQSKEIFVARSFLLPGKLNSPLTFAFSTIEGDRGLLQITSFTDNPRGVKIRYKLVQTETNQNPDARR